MRGEIAQRRHVRDVAVQMHRKHRFGPERSGPLQRRLDMVRAEKPGLGIDVGEQHLGPDVPSGVRRGEESHGRNDNRVAGSEAEGGRG